MQKEGFGKNCGLLCVVKGSIGVRVAVGGRVGMVMGLLLYFLRARNA